MDNTWSKVKAWWLKPEIKQVGKEAVKKLAREPSNAMLTRGKAKAEAHNQVRREQQNQR